MNWFILNWDHYKFVKCFAIWHCWNNWALGSEYFTIVANIFETFWNYLTNTRTNVFPVKKNRAMPCLSWCWFRSFLQANDNRSTWAMAAMVQECARDAVTGPTWDRHKCGTSYHHFLKLKVDQSGHLISRDKGTEYISILEKTMVERIKRLDTTQVLWIRWKTSQLTAQRQPSHDSVWLEATVSTNPSQVRCSNLTWHACTLLRKTYERQTARVKV